MNLPHLGLLSFILNWSSRTLPSGAKVLPSQRHHWRTAQVPCSHLCLTLYTCFVPSPSQPREIGSASLRMQKLRYQELQHEVTQQWNGKIQLGPGLKPVLSGTELPHHEFSLNWPLSSFPQNWFQKNKNQGGKVYTFSPYLLLSMFLSVYR